VLVSVSKGETGGLLNLGGELLRDSVVGSLKNAMDLKGHSTAWTDGCLGNLLVRRIVLLIKRR
jgi:hypothetical protein